MPALERNHLARRDLDWLPPRMKALKWGITGTVWAGFAGAFVAAVFLAHSDQWSTMVGALIGSAPVGFTGDRAARAWLRRRLGHLTRGTADLSSFAREADGELLRVRGRVRAARTIPAFLDEQPVVFRRVELSFGTGLRLVHEMAEDFSLVDEHGETITVMVDRAQLLAPAPKPVRIRRDNPEAAERLRALPWPDKAARAIHRWLPRHSHRRRTFIVWETLLRDGDLVEAVGYKTRVVDPTVASRLDRETPMRATLRSGRELPLLIAPARA